VENKVSKSKAFCYYETKLWPSLNAEECCVQIEMEVTDCLFQQNYGGKDWSYIDNNLPRLLQATVNAIAGKAGSSRQ
jgi:hypothetical protein